MLQGKQRSSFALPSPLSIRVWSVLKASMSRWEIILYITQSFWEADIHGKLHPELKEQTVPGCGSSLAHPGTHKPKEETLRLDHPSKPWAKNESP